MSARAILKYSLALSDHLCTLGKLLGPASMPSALDRYRTGEEWPRKRTPGLAVFQVNTWESDLFP
jgi:hypothetical protein